MAVYTRVEEPALTAFLLHYDIGQAISFKGIAEGVENTNYMLETTTGKFILTLYEKRVEKADLPFFLGLMTHMALAGLPSAQPVANRNGEFLGELCNRTAAIIEFVSGLSVDIPSSSQCEAMGKVLARMHRASESFSMTRPNTLNIAGWKKLATQCGTHADRVMPGLAGFIDTEWSFLAANWPRPTNPASNNIPSGVIHGDLFPDNVMFDSFDQVSGLIDFYFACSDYYAYDLAICLNAWCFGDEDNFLTDNASAFLKGYQKGRALNDDEVRAMPLMLRGAALRFLLTRTYDWLNQVDGAVVHVKNPLEYFHKLSFHQTHPEAVSEIVAAC